MSVWAFIPAPKRVHETACLTPLRCAPLRFFLGSNKVLQVALGRSAEDEHRPGLAALATRLRGDAGLLFTNMERGELETALADAATAHHARAGTTAEDTVELDAGPLIGKARPKRHCFASQPRF